MARNSKQSHTIRLTALSVLLAASAVVSGCSLLPEEQKALKPPLVKPAQAEVRTVDAVRGSITRQITGAGRLVPTKIAYYQFKNGGGVIDEVNVRAGMTVKKGEVMVTLEAGSVDVELLQRELEFERKKLALEDAVMAGNERLVRIARLDYELAKLLYDKTKERAENAILRAEQDGLVSYATDLKTGDQADASRVLVAIADPTGMRLALDAGSNPILKDISVGMEAEVTYKGRTIVGKVAQTPSSAPLTDDARLAEEYGRNLYIELADLPEDAVLGANADVKIMAARRDNAIVIPKRGVRTYFGRTYVQVLDGERRKEVDVETGLENATEIEITQGVEEGMKIILQ